MKPKLRGLSFAMILPLFLYLGYLLVSRFQGWNVLSGSAFGIVIVMNVVHLLPWKGRWITISGLWVLTLLSILGALLLGLMGGVGVDVSAGLLLASPFLLESWIWQSEGLPGLRIVVLQLALLDGVILVAALNFLSTNGLPVTSSTLIYAYGTVNSIQGTGLLHLIVGGTINNLPLQSAIDPAMVILGVLALLGLFVPLLQPQTGGGKDMPFQSTEDRKTIMAYSPELEMVKVETQRLFEGRTRPRPPPYSKLPGLPAIVASGTVTMAFIVSSLLAPMQSLFPAFLSLAIVLVTLLFISRQGRGD